jgi:hypothetical protein
MRTSTDTPLFINETAQQKTMSHSEAPHLSQSTHGPSETSPPAQQPDLTQIYLGLSSYPFVQDPEYQVGLATILGHPETPATAEEIEQNVDLVLQVQCFYFARKYDVPPVDPAGYGAWLKEREREREREQEEQAGAGGRTEDAAQPTLPLPLPVPTPQAQSQAESSGSVHEHSTAIAGLSSTRPADPTPQTQPQLPTQPQVPADDQQPPYPTSFAAIVDLITRNIPVPGIEEIPTTVLEPGSSKVDKTPRRRKPWEKETDQDEGSSSNEDDSKKEEEGDTAAGTGGVDTGGDSSHAAVIDINGHRETGTGVVNILKPNAVPDSGLLSKD